VLCYQFTVGRVPAQRGSVRYSGVTINYYELLFGCFLLVMILSYCHIGLLPWLSEYFTVALPRSVKDKINLVLCSEELTFDLLSWGGEEPKTFPCFSLLQNSARIGQPLPSVTATLTTKADSGRTSVTLPWLVFLWCSIWSSQI